MKEINFNKYFNYDPFEGELTWKPRDETWFISKGFMRSWNTRYADKLAGKVESKNGKAIQMRVHVEGRYYMVHRIIWSMANGEIPLGMLIDHKDGNPLNNKLDNLRLATFSQNLQNRRNKATARTR